MKFEIRSSKFEAPRPSAPGPRPSAFTLVEMLVVIAIIVILIGIAVGITASVTRQAETQKTRMTMNAAESIATEYFSRTGNIINHDGVSPFNWSTKKTHNYPPDANPDKDYITSDASTVTAKRIIQDASIERFIWATYTIREIREGMYTGFDTKTVLNDHSENGFLELNDGWDTKLVYVSGVTHGDSTPGDDFLPEHTQPFFASAGPDGQWGKVNSDGVPDEDAADNLYSFDQD